MGDLYQENKGINNWGSVGVYSILVNMLLRRNRSQFTQFTGQKLRSGELNRFTSPTAGRKQSREQLGSRPWADHVDLRAGDSLHRTGGHIGGMSGRLAQWLPSVPLVAHTGFFPEVKSRWTCSHLHRSCRY